jgi:hypothetical protein
MPSRAQRNASLTVVPSQTRQTGTNAPAPGASFYTGVILIEIIDLNGQKANAVRVTAGDAKSLRSGRADQHCFNQFQRDALPVLKFPKCPAGLTIVKNQLMGPTAPESAGAPDTWAWVIIISGLPSRLPLIADFAVTLLIHGLRRGYLECDIEVPPSERHGKITFEGRVMHNRIQILRSFDRLDGRPMTIKEMVNFNFALASNLPTKAAKRVRDFVTQHNTVMAVRECPPSTSMKTALDLGGAASGTASASSSSSPKKRAASASAARSVRRRPAAK